ncbi:MAG: hypothetical protein WA964_07645 [Ilumatobacter sp.]|uniref:hypothetical protein n=1 Tax=Ilumatobacter sp. TaxID=1967498 RepID=UPI003C7513FC
MSIIESSRPSRLFVALVLGVTTLVVGPIISSSTVLAMERLVAGEMRCFDGELPTGAVIPERATVSATVTGIRPGGVGFISLHSREQAFDETSTLNVSPGINLANTTSYVAGPGGEICVTASVDTDAAIDIVGYDETGGLTIVAERLFDSRTDTALVAGEMRCFDGELASGAVVPEGATVSATVTGIRPDGVGFISLHGRGQAFDETSTLNVNPGLNLANTTSYLAGPGGEICVTASVGTDAAIDIVGFEEETSAVEVGARVYDTRVDGQRLGSLIFPTSRQCFDEQRTGVAIPPEAVVTATLTGIRPLGTGFISILRGSEPLDATSSLNIKNDLNLANTTTFVTDDDGEFCLYSSSNTDATLDVISYEAGSGFVGVNQRIFDTRRAPLVVPERGPIEPVFVSGDESLIGRVTVDCSYRTRDGVITTTVFEIIVDGVVGSSADDRKAIAYSINLFAPAAAARGSGVSSVPGDEISGRVDAPGQHLYMRGTATVAVGLESNPPVVDIFGGGVPGGATFDVPGVGCHEFEL